MAGPVLMHNKTPQNGQAISQLHVLQKNKKKLHNITVNPLLVFLCSPSAHTPPRVGHPPIPGRETP